MTDFLERIKSADFLDDMIGNENIQRISEFYDKAMSETVGIEYVRHVEAAYHDDIAYNLNSGVPHVPFVTLNALRESPEVFGLVAGYVIPLHVYQIFQQNYLDLF